jgi:hypothetical protein
VSDAFDTNTFARHGTYLCESTSRGAVHIRHTASLKFTADGQLECTTCMHADLSATRSCRFPGIVDCVNLFGDPSGCEARCTFEDGHQANMCQSPRGLHPVAL